LRSAALDRHGLSDPQAKLGGRATRVAGDFDQAETVHVPEHLARRHGGKHPAMTERSASGDDAPGISVRASTRGEDEACGSAADGWLCPSMRVPPGGTVRPGAGCDGAGDASAFCCAGAGWVCVSARGGVLAAPGLLVSETAQGQRVLVGDVCV